MVGTGAVAGAVTEAVAAAAATASDTTKSAVFAIGETRGGGGWLSPPFLCGDAITEEAVPTDAAGAVDGVGIESGAKDVGGVGFGSVESSAGSDIGAGIGSAALPVSASFLGVGMENDTLFGGVVGGTEGGGAGTGAVARSVLTVRGDVTPPASLDGGEAFGAASVAASAFF